MRAKLTPGFVLNAGAGTWWDEQLPRFGLKVMPSGSRSFVVQYKVGARTRRVTLPGSMTVTEARRRARSLIGEIAAGRDPMGEKRAKLALERGTLDAVADNFFDREKARSTEHRKRAYRRLIAPVIGKRPVVELRRKEIIAMLDKVEEQRGPSAAEQAFKLLRKILNWHQVRDEDFHSPLVRGMIASGSKPRSRILDDGELRAIWAATAENAPFPALVRFLLLTATRRDEARYMRWAEVSGADWVIPKERYKTGRDHLVPLSSGAAEVLGGIPRTADLVFVGAIGTTHHKHALDRASGVTGWRLHDLRRSARSLMSRAGVDANVAERCLGHMIGGVRGVYDRYQYRDEKARAFEALAALIERIVDPPAANVTAMRRG